MILAAAIKFHINATDSDVVLCGARHGNVYDQLDKLGFDPRNGYEEIEQGFIDHKNKSLIHSLPLESQELFVNRFDIEVCKMDPQDWIDFELGELSHEKCREYGFYSPKDIENYNKMFTTCEHVVNVNWDDNSKGSRCPFGAFGEYNQKIDENGNLSNKCTDCKFYKKRETPIKDIHAVDLEDWKHYMNYKLNQKEYEEKFGE